MKFIKKPSRLPAKCSPVAGKGHVVVCDKRVSSPSHEKDALVRKNVDVEVDKERDTKTILCRRVYTSIQKNMRSVLLYLIVLFSP